jgi:hypothetical protein
MAFKTLSILEKNTSTPLEISVQKRRLGVPSIIQPTYTFDPSDMYGFFIPCVSIGNGLYWNNSSHLLDVSMLPGDVVRDPSMGSGLFFNISTFQWEVSIGSTYVLPGDVVKDPSMGNGLYFNTSSKQWDVSSNSSYTLPGNVVKDPSMGNGLIFNTGTNQWEISGTYESSLGVPLLQQYDISTWFRYAVLDGLPTNKNYYFGATDNSSQIYGSYNNYVTTQIFIHPIESVYFLSLLNSNKDPFDYKASKVGLRISAGGAAGLDSPYYYFQLDKTGYTTNQYYFELNTVRLGTQCSSTYLYGKIYADGSSGYTGSVSSGTLHFKNGILVGIS